MCVWSSFCIQFTIRAIITFSDWNQHQSTNAHTHKHSSLSHTQILPIKQFGVVEFLLTLSLSRFQPLFTFGSEYCIITLFYFIVSRCKYFFRMCFCLVIENRKYMFADRIHMVEICTEYQEKKKVQHFVHFVIDFIAFILTGSQFSPFCSHNRRKYLHHNLLIESLIISMK